MIKILLLEDDDTISFGIEAALKRKGYDCITCPSIEQGRKLFSSDIRLILLDLNLPDGSGYDFCRWVKEQADTPIIFLTVRDSVMDITRGLDMGADDYITKPFISLCWNPGLPPCFAGFRRTGSRYSSAGIFPSTRIKCRDILTESRSL